MRQTTGEQLREMQKAFADPLLERIKVLEARNAELASAAHAALREIETVIHEAFNSATPVCCGKAQQECCGNPDPEWSEYDQRTMDRFAPHQRALNAALSQQEATQ